MKRWKLLAGVLVVAAALLLLPAAALAGPRSGGSFGGRSGFRTPSGSGFRSPGGGVPRGGGYSNRGYGYSTGPSIFFFPGFGGGCGGCGGGGGLLGGIILVLALGMAAAALSRAVRRFRNGGPSWGGDEDADLDQAYVYRAQIALGRSARAIQDRLARFAAEGDTSTAQGLQALLQQTSLELLRERDSFRYVHLDLGERQTLSAAESKMNGMALQERSRFQVERVRSADGKVRRATEAAEEGKEALEYVMVTLVAATRSPVVEAKKKRDESSALDETARLLTALGGVAADSLLGLEVIWTPADPDDSLTETDLLTTYPDLRGV